MVEKGIRVFKDDEEVRIGQKIDGNLLRALDNTQIYIPIFSKGFAFSPWCLREVAHMIDCTFKSDGKKEILPIFFDVEPDDVKLKTNLFRDALCEHEKKYGSREVKRWGDALVEVPTRVGWKLEGKGYGELIKLIVREVLLKLKGKNRTLPDHLVEMNDLEYIEELLDVNSNDHVHFIIIHGTGGIGKSTLASIIFNRFRSKFDSSTFLEDVQSHRLLDMQKKLLSETLGSNSAQEMYDTNDGIDRITRGLGKTKVLIVVDNVDEKKQLENLVGSCDWFGSGSRIVVTLRDIRIIRNKDNQTQPSKYMDYSVKEMPIDLAIQLFSKHAFRSDSPPEDCYKFSEKVVSSVGRLPLTLEVMGSLFASTPRSEWDETLEDLKQAPYTDIRQTLMISINKLDKIEKAIFLDIACFCIGEKKTYAEYMWRNSGYSSHNAIDVLLLMSLIRIDEDNRFWMHDEVRDLGRYIVKKDNIEDAGKRIWVWINENTLDILRSNEMAKKLKVLDLTRCKGLTKTPNFSKFDKLEKLILAWCERLAMIDRSINKLRQLSTLDIRGCHSLQGLPEEIGSLECLSEIIMPQTIKSSLTKPFKLPETLGNLKSLMRFQILSNYSICRLPYSIGKLTNLTCLWLTDCYNLTELPDSIGELELLVELNIRNSCINILPDSIGNLKRLKVINVASTEIHTIPCALGRVETLEELDASYCWRLVDKMPWEMWSLPHLRILDLNGSPISAVPEKISDFISLQTLKISGHRLLPLPKLPSSLKCLVVEDADIPILPDLSSLVHLDHLEVSKKFLRIDYGSEVIGFFSGANEIISLWKEAQSIHRLPHGLSTLKLSCIPQLPDLFGFKSLSVLQISNYPMPHLPILKYLESLRELKISWCEFIDSTPDLSCLKRLQTLYLHHLTNLAKIPGLGEVESLKSLKISFCYAIEQLPNLSKLKNLRHLSIWSCRKLRAIEGLSAFTKFEKC
ncbi:hypothetical protein BT93_H2629 [Corymbia citriodora subsp. variegata]|nr:hypothetical protein BT93_H2629 [Corymbia citriodora subsp. variegata]